MPTGAITGYIDVAQVTLYVFWIFFAYLVLYLHRESKREGYPLVSERTRRTSRVSVEGYPGVPKPKEFKLQDGRTVMKPDFRGDAREIKMAPAAKFEGAPFVATGDPMRDGVGAASWSERAHEPDYRWNTKQPKIEPMRVATEYWIYEKDPDPRGMEVRGADGKVAGTVSDVWIDHADSIIRYLEVDVPSETGTRKVLLPFFLSRIAGDDLLPMILGGKANRHIAAKSVKAEHFKSAPTIKNPDQVTKLEEDKICGYFGGGHLHAMREREEPLI
jgi:photosynthetic reaction center H subunit